MCKLWLHYHTLFKEISKYLNIIRTCVAGNYFSPPPPSPLFNLLHLFHLILFLCHVLLFLLFPFSSSTSSIECLKSIAPKCSCLLFCIIPCNTHRWYLCYMSYIPTLHITSLTFHAGASTSPRVAVHALSRPSIHVPLPELIN